MIFSFRRVPPAVHQGLECSSRPIEPDFSNDPKRTGQSETDIDNDHIAILDQTDGAPSLSLGCINVSTQVKRARLIHSRTTWPTQKPCVLTSTNQQRTGYELLSLPSAEAAISKTRDIHTETSAHDHRSRLHTCQIGT